MKTISITNVVSAVFVALLALSPCGAQATGASFLKVGIGARPLGLGSSFIAVAGDSGALFWNPAGIGAVTKREFTAVHSQWLADSAYDAGGAVFPTRAGNFGLSALGFSYGTLEGRDENRQPTGSFGASDLCVGAAYSRAIMPSISGGIAVKYVEQGIAGEKARGIAFDLGLVGRPFAAPFHAGIAVQNLGPEMRFINESYRLPLSVGAGVAYNFLGSMLVAADIKYQPYDKVVNVSCGTEYAVMSVVSLRAGYLGGSAHRETAGDDPFIPSGLGAGIGLSLFSNRIDYAFTPYGTLGNTHQLSVAVRY